MITAVVTVMAAGAAVAQFDCRTQSSLDSKPYEQFVRETFTFSGWKQGDAVALDGVLADGRHVRHRGQMLGLDRRRETIDVRFIGHGLNDNIGLHGWTNPRATYGGDTLLTDGAGTVHTSGDCRAHVRSRPIFDDRNVK